MEENYRPKKSVILVNDSGISLKEDKRYEVPALKNRYGETEDSEKYRNNEKKIEELMPSSIYV